MRLVDGGLGLVGEADLKAEDIGQNCAEACASRAGTMVC
jgi:hypothetical protein